MRGREVILLLSLVGATKLQAQATGDTCLPAPTIIYFGNGVLNTHAEAESAMGKLDLAVRAKLGPLVSPTSIQFCLAYDSEYQLVNGGLINLPLQLLDALEQEGVELTSQLLSSIANVAFAPPELQDIALASIQSASTVNLAVRPDLQSQEAHYDEDLSAGRKIIVVAHSQGNLYVNQAYTDLAPNPADFNVIAVASPADYVAGGGPWTTLRNDVITLVAGSLLENEFNTNTPGYCNPPPDLTSEINCHSFTDSYLVGNNSGGHIVREIVSDIPKSPQPTWTQLSPALSPLARQTQALAYDSGHQSVLMFGGRAISSFNAFNDTWTWDGNTWAQKVPATVPPARSEHGLAYDALHQEIVMFGGITNDVTGAALGDTWVWDGSNWSHRFPATSPPPRWDLSMAYDAVRNQVVLFGGQGGSPSGTQLLGDTWVWDGTTWTQKFPVATPPARSQHTMTFDSALGQVVLFGGYSFISGQTLFNDTWTWDGNNWLQKTSPSGAPPARRWHAMAYDGLHQAILIFGGYSATTVLNDTWKWDGTAWSQLFPTLSPGGDEFLGIGTTGSSMTYDALHEQIIFFGGSPNYYPGCCGSFGGTWLWLWQ